MSNQPDMKLALEKLSKLDNYSRWVISHFADNIRGRVLEVGAGIGNIVNLYHHQCDEVIATEIFDSKVNYMKERFADNRKIVPVEMDIFDDNSSSGLVEESFDTVICINVLEHIEDDKKALNIMKRLLKKEGHLIIYVPALSPLYCEMDRVIGHYRRYDKGRLFHFGEELKLEVVKNHYANFLGVFPYFLKGKILKKKTAYSETISNNNISVYNFVFRICQFCESLIKPPIGSSELIIYKKGF